MYSLYSEPKPEKATNSKLSPRTRTMFALFARQSRAADSVSVLSTLCRSKVERLMTLSTSAVPVCRYNDSLSSRVRACTSSNSRAFSMAMTAWSAKVLSSSTS
jgi:hypothetical protein